MLGNDARLLTDEEIKSHDLFARLTSRNTIVGEEGEDYELKYLTYLRRIRDENKELFEKIKWLPKKARTAKKYVQSANSVITFFRKGKLRKIFVNSGKNIEEVDLAGAAKILEANKETKRENMGAEFYALLALNKKEFDNFLHFETEPTQHGGGRSGESKLTKVLNAIKRSHEFTDEDENYVLDVIRILKDGAIDKGTIKRLLGEIEGETDSLKILAKLHTSIPSELFKQTFASSSADISGPKEVILSEYLVNSG